MRGSQTHREGPRRPQARRQVPPPPKESLMYSLAQLSQPIKKVKVRKTTDRKFTYSKSFAKKERFEASSGTVFFF
jgi:hypothetical protein